MSTSHLRTVIPGWLGFVLALSACQASPPPPGGASTPQTSVSSSPAPQTSASAAPQAVPSAGDSADGVAAGLGMRFVAIQPGSFVMGDAHDGPPHPVTLSKAYEMQTTEVTQAQWQAVMGDNPAAFKGDNLPIESVSWTQVQTFIQKLNAHGQGRFRLPTEAEWEYAARAGSSSLYACGESEDCLAAGSWYLPNAADTTHPVASRGANPWGLYDMFGNVSEWVADRYAAYADPAVTDPTGAASGDYRVQRGGSYGNYADGLRSARRSYGDPGGSDRVLGFRLVRQ